MTSFQRHGLAVAIVHDKFNFRLELITLDISNGSRTNRSGLGLGQGNNCPGPICPRITNTGKTAFAQEKQFVQLKVEQF